MPRTAHDHPVEEHDLGLQHDLPRLIDRRRALLLTGAGLLTLAGCGGGSGSGDAASSAAAGTSATGGSAAAAPAATTAAAAEEAAACAAIPAETAGPYPGDGSNGPDVLAQSGVVREDITTSLTGAGVAEGVPLTIELRLQGDGCAPLAGAAVYAWHCDREGRYSMYSEGVTGESYLRGVQESGADGAVRFASVFPGCYPGRWPHVHFEVYADVAAATGGGAPIATSQLALTPESCAATYAVPGYESSADALAGVSLASDMVFGDDGGVHQLATMAGDPAAGYTATLVVPVV